MIASDCYRTGQFVISARGYAQLLALSDDGVVTHYRESLRGAIIGAFQQVVAGEESRDGVEDLLDIVSVFEEGDHRLSHVGTVIRTWAKDNQSHYR